VLIFANVYIVPVSVLVGLLCLIFPESRPYGAALAITTVVAAVTFSAMCIWLSSI
jgi:hypothetical protein